MYVVIHNAKIENKKTVQVRVNLEELNGHSIDKLTEKIWDALYNDLDRVSPDERLFVVDILEQVAKQMKQA